MTPQTEALISLGSSQSLGIKEDFESSGIVMKPGNSESSSNTGETNSINTTNNPINSDNGGLLMTNYPMQTLIAVSFSVLIQLV